MNDDRCIALRCGNKSYTVRIPDGIRFQYARLNQTEKVTDYGGLIRDALDHPIGAPRIENLLRPGQRVCIISDDNTRVTPVRTILQELLPRIEGAGILRRDIFIVIALGSHRPMTQEEIAAKFGQDIVDRYQILNSEFENPDMLTQVGTSELGTPIRVYKPAMEQIYVSALEMWCHTAVWAGQAARRSSILVLLLPILSLSSMSCRDFGMKCF